MAAEKSVSPMFGTLGGRLTKAHVETKDAPPDLGQVDLPGGINGGVAELKVLKFGVYENGEALKGKQFFMGSGIMLTPEKHNGKKVAGLPTRIGPIPMFGDTTRKVNGVDVVIPFEDHYKDFTDVLKALGLDVAAIVLPPKNPGESVAAYEKRGAEFIQAKIVKGMEELVAKKPALTFQVRTWQPDTQVVFKRPDGKFVVQNEDGKRPQPGVFPTEEAAKKVYPYVGKASQVKQYWQGLCDRPSVATGGGVVDNTPAVNEPEPNAPVLDDPTPNDGDPMDTPVNDADSGEDLASIGPNELDELVEQAGDPDDAVGAPATVKLLAIADALGVKGDCEGETITWEQVRDIILAAQQAAGGSVEPEPEPEVVPVVAVYKYQQVDKDGNPLKNKMRKVLPPIEVVVKSVNADKKIAQCVDNQTKKVKMTLDFADLIPIE